MAKLTEITSQEAVLKAIAEADELGREGFLEKYDFGPSRSYFLRHDGTDYDSKAILGAARGYQYPDRGPLGAHDFSGGEKTVERALKRLGFDVVRRDEAEPSSRSSGVWIFQGNPDRFRVMDYLHAGLLRISWSVNRYSEAISVGDRVYIWQTAGKSKAQSGIVASCTVASEPWSGPDHEEALPYWVKPADVSSTALRVWLRPGKVANKQEVIKREWLISDPACSGLSILRQAAGTNYPVTTSEATRLEALWSKTGVDWSRAESIAALRVYDQLYGRSISKLPSSPVANLALLLGRAVGGAYNKILNFRSIDPRDDRAGLSGAAGIDHEVWGEFYNTKDSRIDTNRLESKYGDLWPNAWVQPTASAQAKSLDSRSDEARKLNLANLLERYKQKTKNKPPRSATVATMVYDRDPDVVAIAKKRSDLKCEVPGCTQGSFKKPNGEGYIEVHHLITLAEGGLDSPENVAGLCPHHHREIHFGRDAHELRTVLQGVRVGEKVER